MLPAIDFDHEAMGMTGEVREVGADRGLPSKMRGAGQRAQSLPKFAFGVGGILSKTTRTWYAPIN